jgi:hypothetical protein
MVGSGLANRHAPKPNAPFIGEGNIRPVLVEQPDWVGLVL